MEARKMPTNCNRQLILASGSAYRRELLSRVLSGFECISPNLDEAALPAEQPATRAARLAREKAQAVSLTNLDALVIGSDQVAALGNKQLGKPGSHENAMLQLSLCSGQQVKFYTAAYICRQTDGFQMAHTDITTVQFRDLSSAEIESYVNKEQPLDCAGSFKSEGLGVALFESIQNNDPTALIGLPMIWVCNSLRLAGLALP